MSDGEICFNLFSIILLICILYPTKEFVTTGLTIEYLFRNLFGSEDIEFVQYHINRTYYTILLHSFLPLIYVLFYYFQFTIEFQIDSSIEYIKYIIWNSFVTLCILSPIISYCFIKFYWKWYLNHPIVKILKCYSNNGNNCKLIVNDINTEYRNENKFIYQINAITKVIVTENWIIKIKPYNVYFAHQSDTALIAVKVINQFFLPICRLYIKNILFFCLQSDSHSFSQDSVEPIQYVNINVKPTRNGTSEFSIRLNALDFKDLQDRLHRPITILSGVTFNKSIIERFIDVFKEQISLNEKFQTAQVIK